MAEISGGSGAGDKGNGSLSLLPAEVVRIYLALVFPLAGFVILSVVAYVLGLAEIPLVICGAMGLILGIRLNRFRG